MKLHNRTEHNITCVCVGCGVWPYGEHLSGAVQVSREVSSTSCSALGGSFYQPWENKVLKSFLPSPTIFFSSLLFTFFLPFVIFSSIFFNSLLLFLSSSQTIPFVLSVPFLLFILSYFFSSF